MTTRVILRDGQEVARVEAEDAEHVQYALLAWFLRNTPQSMGWALKYEGYSVSSDPT